MHRGLCLPRGRARSAFPPSTCCLLARRSPTQRLSPTRSRRCVLSATIPARSARCGLARRACSPRVCRAVPGAALTVAQLYDTVLLGVCPSNEEFEHQAASWKTARRVVAKVELHFGELFPRVGFIVVNLSAPSRGGGAALQQARNCRPMDQGRQAGGEADAAFLPPFPRQ